jgi:peptidoglycan/xylan/chitin deacetylase (PgdA/CDA1 family)
MLRELNTRFGCRFTLFMPTNYHAQFDLRDRPAWFASLVGMGCFEVACHGHHHWNLASDAGEMEYLSLSEDEARWCIQKSLEAFGNLGHRPTGVKAPGWGYSPGAMHAIRESFAYMADHLIGTDWATTGDSSFVRLPYARCIHEPLDDLLGSAGPLLVLCSHISPEDGRHDNGWSEDNYENVRGFLGVLTARSDRPVEFVTAAEALPSGGRSRERRTAERGLPACE